ncbi:F-box/LRR-repeat protein 15 [Hibiscus syriacus]|uniref:F-box/LRR-repeat protein 15 n=1 Tax=Hibiscus syriacus TaxID=106335 RepID=A0A6A2X7J4_HIBSY|nr:F-box/LRR-repeat protein 15 [Hibiscus syriacus]
MKIWCCLWFIDDEGNDNQLEGTMKEGFLANVDDIEGNIVKAGDEETSACLTVSLNRNLNCQRQGDETMLSFQENFTAMRYGGNWVDPLWRHSVGCSPSSLGETRASASTAVEDCDHRDSHHKRAKVYTVYHESTSYSSAERDYSIKQCSSISSNNGRAEDYEIRMDLTDDLLHMAFSFLDPHNLCVAAMVCRQWRSASAHEDFWWCLNFENRNISLEQFDDMCQRYPNATEVNLSGTPYMHLLVMKAVYSLRNLEALTLGKGQLGDDFFLALTKCSMLRSLDVNDAILGDGSQEIPINHDRLCDLKVTKCRVMRISISEETLREIASTCSNLHVLNSSYCPNISLESVRLPMLTVLKLDNCEGITSASMAAIAYSDMLEELELNNCHLLTSVSLGLPLSNCVALHRINISSNALKKLALQKQENMTMLALQCQGLQEVHLTDCASLTDSICNVFSDGGGCPMLKSLVLDNCESLTALQFSSTSLVNLSLVGCRAITTLDLACPCLEKICLDGCDHLERASFCPVALRSINLGICPKLNTLRIDAPLMVSLELKGCGVLSEASINCPLLTSLDASFCSQLKDDCLFATTASCHLFKSLILMSCPSIGSDGLYSLHWLPNLTTLDLSYTFLTNLQPVFESCLQLKVLKLQACKYLSHSSLEPLYKEGALRELRDLDLSYVTLCQSAIEELLAYCTRLTHLSLNGCINMHDLNLGSPASRIEFLGVHKDLACFLLEHQCASRAGEQFTAEPELLLKLSCPRLISLFLQSCNIEEEAVESAISQCAMLETLDVRFCPKICAMSMGRFRVACPSLKRIYSSLSPA